MRRTGNIPNCGKKPIQEEGEAKPLFLPKLAELPVASVRNVISNFPRHNRRNALQCVQNRLIKRCALRRRLNTGNRFLRRDVECAELILGRRKLVGKARQDKAFRRHFRINTLERIDHFALFVNENNVAVTSHNFRIE